MADNEEFSEHEVEAPARPKRSDLARRDGLERVEPHLQGSVPIDTRRGGASYGDMVHMMNFAKLMCTAGVGVPEEFRGNAGLCLRVVYQADEWGLSPFGVADECYVVNGKLAYGAKLIHALIEKFANLERKLQMRFEGDGADMTCTVIAHVIGEPEPIEYTSPKIREIKVKNSPLWTEDPKRQLFYYASRAMARMHFPNVLMGVFARDEMPEHQRGADNAKIMGSGTVVDRLPGPKAPGATGEGFDPENINRSLQPEKPETAETTTTAEPAAETPAADEGNKAKKRTRKPASESKDPPAKDQVQTPEQYVAYVESYIEKAVDADDLGATWKNERDLRQKIGVKGKMMLALETKLDAKIKSLSNA
jgi:hypothetical protein